MDPASRPVGDPLALDPALLSAAVVAGCAAARTENGALQALDAALAALHDTAPALLPSLFVLEHGRIWLVVQRGYAVVPDGMHADGGVTGRAVRLAIMRVNYCCLLSLSGFAPSPPAIMLR